MKGSWTVVLLSAGAALLAIASILIIRDGDEKEPQAIGLPARAQPPTRAVTTPAATAKREPLKELETPTRLERQDLEAGLARVRALLDACAARAVEPGILEAKMTIAPSGNVEKVELPDSPISGCVRAALGRATFPAFRPTAFTSIEWRYPVVMRPAQQ